MLVGRALACAVQFFSVSDFFPCVFFIYYALSFRFRKYMLLLASYYFYMCWKPEFIVLILSSTTIDYFCGLGIEKHRKNA